MFGLIAYISQFMKIDNTVMLLYTVIWRNKDVYIMILKDTAFQTDVDFRKVDIKSNIKHSHFVLKVSTYSNFLKSNFTWELTNLYSNTVNTTHTT